MIDTVAMKVALCHSRLVRQPPIPHVVERHRLVDYETAKEGLARDEKENFRAQPQNMDWNYRGKHLQLAFTVEDPNVFTTPWSATVTYGKPAVEWLEQVCAENPRKYGTEEDAQVPTDCRMKVSVAILVQVVYHRAACDAPRQRTARPLLWS